MCHVIANVYIFVSVHWHAGDRVSLFCLQVSEYSTHKVLYIVECTDNQSFVNIYKEKYIKRQCIGVIQ